MAGPTGAWLLTLVASANLQVQLVDLAMAPPVEPAPPASSSPPVQRPTVQRPRGTVPAAPSAPAAQPAVEPLSPVEPEPAPVAPQRPAAPDALTDAPTDASTTGTPEVVTAPAPPPAAPAPLPFDPALDGTSTDDRLYTENREALSRELRSARGWIAVGGVLVATGTMMGIGATIEAVKDECQFDEASCEDPPRKDVVLGLGIGGGVSAFLGALAVGLNIPRLRRARLQLDATRRHVSAGATFRF